MVQQGGRSIFLLLMLTVLGARVYADNNTRSFLQIHNNAEWLQGVPVVLAVLGIVWGSLATAGAPLLLLMLKLGMILVALPVLLQTTEVTNSDPENQPEPQPEPTTTMPPRIHTYRSGFQNGVSYLMKTILGQTGLLPSSTRA